MLPYFSLTLFVSAFLLFLVQPMVGKMILPRLGGTPAVWNTCMVFFQAVLLVGYAYTHTLSSWGRRAQLVTQGVLLFLPLLVLPFAVGSWTPDPEATPIFSVLLLMLGMVGLPFFVVSTSAPLLQKWFGHTGHPAARDPYFLYGASNFGSMLALLAYPLVVEPWLGVDAQALWWTRAYFLFLLLVLGCVAIVWTTSKPVPLAADALLNPTVAAEATAIAVRPQPTPHIMASTAPARHEDDITLVRRLRWIGLAAVPSSLMLGVTTYMTTDIAAVPSFWVIPLALYLLTFILVFARWPVVWTTWPHEVVLYLQPCFVLFLILMMVTNLAPSTLIQFALHVVAFLACALLCHGELAKDRPSARHLTEFYLWMSLGGVLGGLFNALFAPLVLRYGIWEYPIALALASLLRPNLVGDTPLIPGDSTTPQPTPLGRLLDALTPLFIALMGLGFIFYVDHPYGGLEVKRSYMMALAVVVLLTLSMRPVRFGLGISALFFAITFYDRHFDRLVYEDRGFFGLLRVREADEKVEFPDGRTEMRTYRTLIHGGINHGRQIMQPESMRATPITYFHPTNGVGEIYGKFSWPNHRLPASLVGLGTNPLGLLVDLHSEPAFAVLGLGTGTLACHARPLQTVHFYEIDPLVRDLSLPANDARPVFYYLHDALERGANLHVIMGDGRLKLKEGYEQKPHERYYHVISLDAFSSDAIPMHLLTKEAVQLYLDKLADGGVLIFNTTNRYVRIEGPLAAIARDLDLDCLYCPDYPDETIHDKYAADWLVLQRKAPPGGFRNGGPPLLQRLNQKRWQAVTPLEGPIWTDNYSNLLKVMSWRS